jgi:hypothetical protein
MPVSESSIAEVVAEASAKMHDPQYISNEVDRFIGGQPAISQLVMAASAELTVEGVVTVLFHAALLARSVARHTGKTVREVTAEDLQRAAQGATTAEELAAEEPHLASYIASNVEESTGAVNAQAARSLLAQVARALVG